MYDLGEIYSVHVIKLTYFFGSHVLPSFNSVYGSVPVERMFHNSGLPHLTYVSL